MPRLPLNLHSNESRQVGGAKLQSAAISYYGGYYVQRGHLRQTPTVVGRNLTQSSEARSEFTILRITSVFVCVSYPPQVLYYLWYYVRWYVVHAQRMTSEIVIGMVGETSHIQCSLALSANGHDVGCLISIL